ncbi:hypothetical protein DICPUDRAFT_40822 [Dictyostelium purpureum]|uniref:Lipoyl-binding domain-containing protein n=1 Tax=Dictyostelium purpureum TaxID=5786 RepID=F0ZYV5_DICPU|nr:uncharacterized protein DICPUDRAFT_40822 [Dictyostelium purpureum]EGC30862.1 hypothetical protein DICPUDRAFT_40822 [Dictyostelium purpureum]|eukprot:XP_003292599.1 hypothetical protein DICPUDRAFT_40822 [Dictyostelium purpureum]
MQRNKNFISILYRNIYNNNNNKRFFSYKFTPSHQWVKLLKDSNEDTPTTKKETSGDKCLIGITNYANIAIDKVTDVKLPNINDTIKKNQPIISIKTLEGDINFLSPISGKVIKVNEEMKNNPTLINKPLTLKQSWTMELLINEQDKKIIKTQLMDQLEYAHYCNDVDFKQF